MTTSSAASDDAVPAVADSLWAGLLIHALPLIGVYALGWSLFSVMLIYYLEAAVMMIFGVMRVVWFGPEAKRRLPVMLFASLIWFAPALGFMVAFFFGFVNYFYIPGEVVYGDTFPSSGELAQRMIAEWLWVPVLLIFASHLYGYINDWIRAGAYRHSEGYLGLWQVYGTMFVTLLVLLVTASIVLEPGMGSAAVAFVVLVRIALDVGNHFLLPMLVKRR